ncbi:hypothetical protein DQ154_00830 [Escherichia coli]|nr:hypothetical protein [Escherichia coli]EMA4329807.1 hypothetical protein [Escherichia coli]
MSNTYLDRMPKYQPSKEALDKKAFDEEMNKTAERVIDLIPDLLADIIDGEAARLADLVPEVLRKPDPVTHDIINEKHIRRMLAGKISNRLGHGMGFLQK